MKTQVLREIDKLDRLGPDDVRAMLGAGLTDASGANNRGCGLMAWQIEVIMKVITADDLDQLETQSSLAIKVGGRFRLIAALDDIVTNGGATALDNLLNMPANAVK